MIVKEADAVVGDSIRAQAGARAEKDMAFYLRRAFGNHRSDVLVFNDLRLQHEGEVAQIDHLVVHPHGMFIIESKSVSGEIHILPDGQFVRYFGRNKKVGMPSPVLQAQRQAELLRRLLQAHKTELRDRKLLGLLQGGFAHCPIEIRVAISDQGIIKGDRHAPEVRKADQITKDIEERIAAHRRGGSLLNLDLKCEDGLYRFTPDEMRRLQQFLLDQHVPRPVEQMTAQTTAAVDTRKKQSPSPVDLKSQPASMKQATGKSASTPTPQFLCSKCHSLNLCILYGKYGYYFKCQDCGGNTWIDTRIDGSGKKGRIRKSGSDFFLVCPDSGTERLFFTNPDATG